MTRKKVDSFLGKLVAITFTRSWFNEAVQSWVDEEEEYVGILNRCTGYNQSDYYQLDSKEWLPTDNACWRESRIKTIREVLL